MLVLGLIKEGKTPADNRVALTPSQCKWLLKNIGCKIIVEPSAIRCFKDAEYAAVGCILSINLMECNILLGIKEVPITQLIDNKTYVFFSHTRKKQPYNKALLQAMMAKGITLIDYECLTHEDGQRIIGFGFFAGIVGAHNGMMAYGERTKLFSLQRVYACKDYSSLVHTYFGLKLPAVKIAVTGSGRVAHGILEVMNLMDVQEVDAEEYLTKKYTYPVYVHLKGGDLYEHKVFKKYNRDDFHQHPSQYNCMFDKYLSETDILMNGIYWDTDVPKLFSIPQMQQSSFTIKTIADITDDAFGSVPCNLGDATIEDPVYGVDINTQQKTAAYLSSSVDVMAVGNLPNELPRDASKYFGAQLIKYVLNDILNGGSDLITRATILNKGKLTPQFHFLADYAGVAT